MFAEYQKKSAETLKPSPAGKGDRRRAVDEEKRRTHYVRT